MPYDPVKAREYYLLNKEKIKARNAAWWKSHPEQRRAKLKRRYWRNPEKRRKMSTAWKAKNREHSRSVNSEWQKRTWQSRHSHRQRYYSENKEFVLGQCRKYHQRNPWRAAEATNKRRALERKSAINLKQIGEWMARVKALPTFTCYYCEKIFSTEEVHFDHIIALARGGPHSIENLCSSCPTCNLSKGCKPIRLWIKMGQQILEL